MLLGGFGRFLSLLLLFLSQVLPGAEKYTEDVIEQLNDAFIAQFIETMEKRGLSSITFTPGITSDELEVLIKMFNYSLTALTPVGRVQFTVGDRVKVTVERVDLIRREMDLTVVARKSRGKKKAPAGKKRARKQGRKDQPLRTHYRGRRGKRK